MQSNNNTEIDLTVVVPSRNDDYGGKEDFVNRTRYCLERNLTLLENSGLSFEVVYVDWCSGSEKLYEKPELSELFKSPRVKNIVVDRTVPEYDGLNPNVFKEYFAKNIGIRRASGRYVLATNLDIAFDEELVSNIVKIVQTDDLKHFWRPRCRSAGRLQGNVFVPGENEYCWIDGSRYDPPHYMTKEDEVTEIAAGDFLLAHRTVFHEVAKGYDETNPQQRGQHKQTSVDGDILWQMHRNGVTRQYVDTYIHVIEHDNKGIRVGDVNRNGYVNRDSWGYVNNVLEKKIGDNVWHLTAKRNVEDEYLESWLEGSDK